MSVNPDFAAKADQIVARYPVKRSVSLPLLHLWQEEYGYVSDEGIRWIAEKLGLEPINIYELVTFYPMLRQKPIGEYHIKVCRTLACQMAGSREVYEHFKKLTGAVGDEREPLTSPDGKYTVEFVECLACCATAPVVMVNDDLHELVDAEKVQEIIQKYN